MHHHDHLPDRDKGRGLTTEDLAGLREDREPAAGTEPEAAAPVYPGEAARTVDGSETGADRRTEPPGDAAAADGGPDGPDGPAKERQGGAPVAPGDRAPDEIPVDASTAATTGTETGARVEEPTGGGADEEAPELLSARDVDAYRTRWQQIQNDFVDDPREAVHAADGLVADVMRTLAETFAEHKRGLEGQWNQGEAVDTESLRMALRQYRSFFHRLLTK
ncbi:hypothetical protein ACWGIN_18835 [Streptomyces sp. NPDC054861]